MKKLFASLMILGSLALSACAATIYKTEPTSKTLKDKGYTVVSMTAEQAKVLVGGIDIGDLKLEGALNANKGTGKDRDFLFAFFFNTVEDASNFMSKDDNANLAAMNNYGQVVLGENLQLKLGTHNNVAYVGSETSFAAAFN